MISKVLQAVKQKVTISVELSRILVIADGQYAILSAVIVVEDVANRGNDDAVVRITHGLELHFE